MKPYLVVAAGLFAVSLTVVGHADVKPTRPNSGRTQPRARVPRQSPSARPPVTVKQIRGLSPPRLGLGTPDLMRGLISAPAFPPEIWLEARPGR